MIYLITLVVVLVYFSLWFVFASKKNRTDYVDIAWGGGFLAILATSWAISQNSTETISYIVAACVTVWALRITYHLGKRNFASKKDDPRYTEIKQSWKGNIKLKTFVRIFLFQGLLVWLISLPVIASWNVTVDGLSGIYIGLAVWVIGFLFESIADAQLAKFNKNSQNKGKIMDKGLWRYSRHPNYFGEITQWWGIWLMVLYINPVWWTIIGPLTITYLIVKVSGIPPSENRYKGDKLYDSYKKRTSALIPEFPGS